MSLNHVIKNYEAIISIDAEGFIFGSAILLQALIVARKPGKISWGNISRKLPSIIGKYLSFNRKRSS